MCRKLQIPFSDLSYGQNIKNDDEFSLTLYYGNEQSFRLGNHNLEGFGLEEIQEIMACFDKIKIQKIC